MTNNSSIQEVLFFPQMRPEKKSIELTDNEKTIFSILKKINKIELSDLKIKSNLSNKAWDKGIKGLTKNGLALVSKTENKLFVEIK
jgi:lysyl-tRNA synthetase class 2